MVLNSCPNCLKYYSKELYIIDGFSISQCLNCELIYMNPRLSTDEVNSLYRKKEYFFNSGPVIKYGYRNYPGLEPLLMKNFKKRMQTVLRYKDNGKILDIGCAAGFFLKVASDFGWQVYGSDLSPFAKKYCYDRYAIDISIDGLGGKDYPDNFFDVVTMWEVFEHFPEPSLYLYEAHRILKKGGYIFISTPNIDTWLYKCAKKHWVGFNKAKEHLCYFSPKTITAFLRKSGFRIIRINPRSDFYIDLRFCFEKLSNINRNLEAIFNSPIAKILSRLNFYFNFKCLYMEIIAGK